MSTETKPTVPGNYAGMREATGKPVTREDIRRDLISAAERLWKYDADLEELPTPAREKNPPDSLRAVAESAVRLLEEIRAEDEAKGRPWWKHTLARFVLDDLIYALSLAPQAGSAGEDPKPTVPGNDAVMREALALVVKNWVWKGRTVGPKRRIEGVDFDELIDAILPALAPQAGSAGEDPKPTVPGNDAVMREALDATKAAADDLAQACIDEGDSKGAGALQFISGFISDRLAALSTAPAARPGDGETP